MKKIRIKTGKQNDFNTTFQIKGVNYHVQTEEGSEKNPVITSTAFLGGSVVEKLESPCPGIDKLEKSTLRTIMRKHHEQMIAKVKRKHLDATRSRVEYVKDARKRIARKDFGEAYSLIEDAMVIYPDDPFIMSIYGFLKAAHAKEYRFGIDTCKHALMIFKDEHKGAKKYELHFLYLNLARAYLAGGKKDFGVRNLREALRYDKNNRDILNELARLGVRKPPPLGSLARDHFLNRCLGKLLAKLGLR